ncbi:DUF2254 domain-containing protein [Arthrobacter antioxidans]|uniref:DUF2254 domain-containing protein n=1 Tax=Arthrobacter antioxidans TaxID=2895818 RepID=UPI002000326F|nr:DUF2254 domain-containing protein [Arthrobacter antioxidans]
MSSMDMSKESVRESLRVQLWPVPLVAVILALILGQTLPSLDRHLDDSMPPVVSGILFGGGPEAARSLLETIAGSTITVTSLTFSLTVVTLQLASSQFSPRLLRTFTRDRFVHNTLALFLATFVFALTVLRSIRVETSAGPAFVPEIAVTTAFVLTIITVIGLVLFLAYLARQIRVETMLRDVHRETDETLERVFPEHHSRRPSVPSPDGRPDIVHASSSGFLTRVDTKALLSAAARLEAFVTLDVAPGASLVAGVPVARVWSAQAVPLDGDRLAGLADAVSRSLRTGFERTSTQDPSFGLQQLLDVTDKALSPGVNDPTTAVHALSHISAILCSLTARTTGPVTLYDTDDRARLNLTLPSFAELLDLVMDQLVTYAFTGPRTASRSIAMLSEITISASRAGTLATHAPALHGHRARARTAVETSTLDPVIRADLLSQLNDIDQQPQQSRA